MPSPPQRRWPCRLCGRSGPPPLPSPAVRSAEGPTPPGGVGPKLDDRPGGIYLQMGFALEPWQVRAYPIVMTRHLGVAPEPWQVRAIPRGHLRDDGHAVSGPRQRDDGHAVSGTTEIGGPGRTRKGSLQPVGKCLSQGSAQETHPRVCLGMASVHAVGREHTAREESPHSVVLPWEGGPCTSWAVFRGRGLRPRPWWAAPPSLGEGVLGSGHSPSVCDGPWGFFWCSGSKRRGWLSYAI